MRRSPVFLVPGEDVLVAAVDLPLPGLRQRRAALPFAVEDLVSEPLSGLHIAMGAEIAPRRHLAGIARHALMQEWHDAAAAEGPACRIVPDMFALPVPENPGWAVARTGDRVLVRCGDATGFAIAAPFLVQAWNAAGRPPVISYAESLPPEIPADRRILPPETIAALLNEPALDLRQGAYAARTGTLPAIARKAAIFVAAGLALHTLVAALDLFALDKITARREAEAQTLVQQLAPGAPAGGDVVEILNRLLPGDARAGGVRFLPLFAQTATALQPFARQTSVQTLAFNASDGTLTLSIEGSDLAILQSLEQALRDAGLDPVSGPATTDRGAAEFRVTVRGVAG